MDPRGSVPPAASLQSRPVATSHGRLQGEKHRRGGRCDVFQPGGRARESRNVNGRIDVKPSSATRWKSWPRSRPAADHRGSQAGAQRIELRRQRVVPLHPHRDESAAQRQPASSRRDQESVRGPRAAARRSVSTVNGDRRTASRAHQRGNHQRRHQGARRDRHAIDASTTNGGVDDRPRRVRRERREAAARADGDRAPAAVGLEGDIRRRES